MLNRKSITAVLIVILGLTLGTNVRGAVYVTTPDGIVTYVTTVAKVAANGEVQYSPGNPATTSNVTGSIRRSALGGGDNTIALSSGQHDNISLSIVYTPTYKKYGNWAIDFISPTSGYVAAEHGVFYEDSVDGHEGIRYFLFVNP